MFTAYVHFDPGIEHHQIKYGGAAYSYITRQRIENNGLYVEV